MTISDLRRVPIGPVRLATRERSGNGAAVLFIHGSWDDHASWLSTWSAMSQTNHLFAYDRRGHSASTDVAGQGTIGDDVDDAAGLIRHIGAGPVHVVGHSYGANIAIQLGVAHPQLVSSLYLHEPPLFGLLGADDEHRRLADAARRNMASVVELIDEGAIEAAARTFYELVAFGPGSWSETFDHHARATAVANVDTWLDQFHDPQRLAVDVGPLVAFAGSITISCGSNTLPSFAAVCGAVVDLVPAASLVTIDGAGHAAPVTHGASLAAAIGRHLRE
ncbi:MAG: alpha/beta hydrolase [Actinomycetota bacterium]